jgi:polyhydroxybutyrate depolymerase
MRKVVLMMFSLLVGEHVFPQLDSIKNPNFERWTASTLNNWATVNASKATGGDILGVNTLVLTTTSGPTPGMAVSNGSIVSGKGKGGFPFRMRPEAISFSAKYTQGGGADAPVIQVVLTKWNGTSRDTLGLTRGTIPASGSYAKHTIALDYDNAPSGGNPSTITHYIGNKAIVPDTAQIILLSSGQSTAVSGSLFFVDSLAFVFDCELDSNIPTTGTEPINSPSEGDTLTALAGQPFSFHMTSYIPKTVTMSVPFFGTMVPMSTTIDSIQTSSNELSGSAVNFLTVDPDQFNNRTGGNSINCISFSGNIPASPANAIYNLIITPLMWGTPSLGNISRLEMFPSPQTITIYIKVGNGGDTIVATDNIQWETMTYNGETRKYNVYTPSVYDGTTPVPLLFNIHGWTGSSTKQMDFGDFRAIADTANFLIVHPQALGNVPSWDLTGTSDSDFLMILLDSLQRKYNIDTNRIYSTGFSQGGVMSYVFACKLSSRIAAVAPVAGAMTGISECKPIHYMPLMHVHGTEDLLASYSDVQACLDYFVNGNQCNKTPIKTNLPDVTSADNSTVEHWVYDGGQCGSRVEHYRINNGGHEWPTLTVNKKNNYGVDYRNNDYEASLKIWQFLSQYRLDQLCSVDWPTATSIASNEQVDNISVYPNPSNGSFTVSISDYEGSEVKIVDVLGKVIFKAELKKSITNIDLGNISKGIYFYQIQTTSDKGSSGKIVVE